MGPGSPTTRRMTINSKQGLIYNIERFAMNDGPGIRTLVFMKGCPLRCLWCSSPQTQQPLPQILYDPDLCQDCRACLHSCENKALNFTPEHTLKMQPRLCDLCGNCIDACPDKALEMAGRYMTPEELFREVVRDAAFFRRSQGGVTVGGGEPTMQHLFVAAFLRKCKTRYIHTAIETCGYCTWDQMKAILEYTDMVFMDIKHLDDAQHRRITGVSNRIILENADKISGIRPLTIRIPIVPGWNDSEENIRKTARFAAQLGGKLQKVELLPYHELGVGTYRRLGRIYSLEGTKSPGQGYMRQLQEIVEQEF